MSPILGARGGLSASAYGLFAPSLAANSYESISTVSVGAGGSTNINFASISGTYKHLQIRSFARLNHANWWATMAMRFNGDTGNNYSYHDLGGQGASTFGQNATSQPRMYVGWAAGTTSPSSTFGACIIDILDYANTNKNKTTRSLTGIDGNGGGIMSLESNAWYNTNAITSIDIFPWDGTTFQQYSQFALYGIKG